ncbi:major facilitator superfamily domain-containing protein [Aspergillus oleicola]
MSQKERVRWKVTSKLQKGRLLAAGYYQGMMGGVNGSYVLSGYFGGVFYWGSVGDRLGRIKFFAIGACWGIVEALLQCTAKTPLWIIVARFVNGIGTGILKILNAIMPSRGQFIAMAFTLNILGVIFQWRLPIVFQVVMLLILLGGCWFFPESPRWLCTARRHDILPHAIGLGSEDLHIARRVQLSMWIAGLNNTFYTFATLICDFTLDRIGRRWTLWWGAAGQAIAMFLAGGSSCIDLDAETGQEGWGTATTAMVYLYTFIFGATWLTVPWLYPAEIFPLMCRAKGNAWGVVGWSLGNGSLTLALPYVFDALGEKTDVCLWSMWVPYPESSQRMLEEIDLLFAADSPWAWTAESNFQELRAANPSLELAKDVHSVRDPEKALEANNEHLEVVDNRRQE